MLILIVVAAAVALAAFVAGYESQYLAEQATAHNKALEDVQIVSITPFVNNTPGANNYSSITVILESLDIQNTTVREVTLNGQPLASFTVKPLGTQQVIGVCELCGSSTPYPTVPQFQIAPEQQVNVSFNLSTWLAVHRPGGGVYSPFNLTYDHFIEIGVYTLLGNDFTRAFYPPTAVVQLGETTQYVGGSTPEEDMLVLNGQNSPNPPNATTVWWSWTFTPYTPGLSTDFPRLPLLGEEVLVPQQDFPTCTAGSLTANCPEYYNITLTVQDSDGLFGNSTAVYEGFT
jgi:hypothetical protein